MNGKTVRFHGQFIPLARMPRLLAHSAEFYANLRQFRCPFSENQPFKLIEIAKREFIAQTSDILYSLQIRVKSSFVIFEKFAEMGSFQQQAACLKFHRLVILQQQRNNFRRMLIFHFFLALFFVE